MHKSLLTAGTLFAMIITTMIAPLTASARRCPVEMPKTLLQLYRTSDTILKGTFEKAETGDVIREDEDYKVLTFRRHFTISSALKGDGPKMFVLEEELYEFKGEAAAAAAVASAAAAAASDAESADAVEPEPEEAGYEEPGELKPGDTVLLFLKRNEETGKDELADGSFGIKQLSGDDLGVYESRIAELGTIFSVEVPNQDEIVEWLVRCAENKATRWEGTFELLQSFERAEWQEEFKREQAERAAKGETVEDIVFDEEADSVLGDTTIFSRLLTDGQKQRLSDILLNKQMETGGEANGSLLAARGDRELMELTRRWGGHGVARVLLDQLRGGAGEGYDNYQIMSAVASIMGDQQLNSILEEFGNVYYQEDSEVPKPAKAESGVPTDGEMAISADDESVPAAESDEKAETFGEIKSKIVSRFLTRADTIMAAQEAADAAVAGR